MRTALTGLLIGLLLSSTALAEGPAVSAINGKIEGIGGNVNGDSTNAAAFSITAPLGERFGAQFDAALGEIDDADIQGVGLHLFTRDPEKYLFGVNGIYADVEDLSLERFAVEGEYYWGSFTLAGLVGHQDGDLGEIAFANTDIRWYPIENLMLETGGSVSDNDNNKGHIGAEYQLLSSLSVFADFAAGNDNYEHALLGARYYIGTEKTLVKRHREDDPINNVLISAIESMAVISAAPEAPEAAAACATYTTTLAYGFDFIGQGQGHGMDCGFTAEVDCNGIIQSIPDAANDIKVNDSTIFNGQSIGSFKVADPTGCF